MSASLNTADFALSLNATTEDSETRDVIYECKVLNITILSLAVCILAVTAVVCCVSYLNRRRHRKWACVYKSTVTHDLEEEPVNLKVMRRSQSLCKPLALFRTPQALRVDDSSIYYIYSNPLPVGLHEDDVSPTHATHTPLMLNDPKSGIVLDPPTFYMQL